jgi:putative hydrolase of the HAD superfamily
VTAIASWNTHVDVRRTLENATMHRHLLDTQTLLLDADDTLWENNVYYEQSFDEFVAFLGHEHLSAAQVRHILDRFEIANGYGARAFARSLKETFAEISGESDENKLRDVERLGLRILEIDIEIMPGVERTLEALRPHHDLFLFTKGELEEQQLKIQRSGIGDLFDAHIVAADKKPHTYADLVDSFGLDPEHTWMVGNSPRSDIQPALEAGLHAVFIPHPMTWHLEHVDIEHHPGWRGRFEEIQRFEDLLAIFRHTAATSERT